MYLQEIEERNSSLSLNGTDVVLDKDMMNGINDTEGKVRIVALHYSDPGLFPSDENVSAVSWISDGVAYRILFL